MVFDPAWLPKSIPALFFAQAAKRDDAPFLWRRRDGAWQATSWAETACAVRLMARGLADLGITRGDRVAIIAENGPEWIVADLAIMAAGGITVPAYTTFITEDYRHVLADSDARGIILGSAALGRRVLPALTQLDSVAFVIALEPLHPAGGVSRQSPADIYLWGDILDRGQTAPDAVDEIVASLDRSDTACLIYTSGTGGLPKGVMLTHLNMLSNAWGAEQMLARSFKLDREIFLSFLPLTHSYEHTAGFVLPLHIAAEIYFSSSETLMRDLVEVRPTIMTAVPRLFETMRKRIASTIERSSRIKRALFAATLRLGRKRFDGSRQSLSERAVNLILDLLVRRAMRRRFGGRLKVLVSGGAPLNPDVALFFLSLGVTVIQGYGQTESGPVVGVNPPGHIKAETVGPPLDGIEVRIAEDGEVLVRGPNIMKGYWRDPETTARVLRDGWLHTGDIGQLDEDGYLRITDRKRDFIKTSGGDMVAPQRIEGILTLQPGIAQALVHGDQRPYLIALIVPDGSADDAEAVKRTVAEAVSEVNRTATHGERIRRHAILETPFTVENGQMTPTLKIKRHVIRRAHQALIDALYDAKIG